MLGKHLSPRLYIGYGIGIFERFNAFRMRYTLSKHWNLQAETGLESGADLFYTLER
jgi:translocation and assembly module TamB